MWLCYMGTKAHEVIQYCSIELEDQCPIVFKQYCKKTVKDKFLNYWTSKIQNSFKKSNYQVLQSHKTVFCIEQYLVTISDIRYRIALKRLRTSYHTLEIEPGRYTVPRPVFAIACV